MPKEAVDRSSVPHKPGVYIFKDQAGAVLYVGKAIDLHSRVSSYFTGTGHHTRTAHMVQKVEKLETIVVESEIEALVLEANLIKKYLPPYNIRLTDDKDYLYIRITKEPFAKIETARKQELKGSQDFFGPFPSSRTVRDTLKKIRRVFPWCSNPPGPGNKTGKACFYQHLNLCPGACIGAITQPEYQQNIDRFAKFMSGQSAQLLDELTVEMNSSAEELKFEQAAALKKTIEGIQYLLQPNRASVYLENPNFMNDQKQKALEEIRDQLALPELPARIECFDISNIQGTNAVGSMVVLTNGEIDKSQYRKFKIKATVKTGEPNDFAMMAEVVRRRLKNDWATPNLILIDGGIGQVRAAKEMLDAAGVEIPIFGLAKRFEWLYSPTNEVVKMSKKSPGLQLIQTLRDEAHRFALGYHRKLRSQATFA